MGALDYTHNDCIGLRTQWVYWTIHTKGVLDYTHKGCIGLCTQWVYWTTHTKGVLDYTHIVTARMSRDRFYVSVLMNEAKRGGVQEEINDVHKKA